MAIINGPPGQTWTNNTGTVFWQWNCARINTCGRCWANNGKVSRSWYLPLHDHCRCYVVPVSPGTSAPQPFVDFRKAIDRLPRFQQVKVAGASVLALVDAGLATWDDVVANNEIRSFREVMAALGISVAAALKAGVRPAQLDRSPRRSSGDLSPPPMDLFRRLDDLVAKRPAVALPTILLPDGTPRPLLLPEATRRAQAAELAALLMVPPDKRRLTAEEQRIVAAELGASAASSVAAFLATVARWAQNGRLISEAATRIYEKYRG